MSTTVKKYSGEIFPQKAYDLFRKEPYCAILDSSLESENGKYSIIGIHPFYVLKEQDGKTYANDRVIERDFEDALSDFLLLHKEENHTGLPLISGGIGYFTYDYGCKFENIPISNPKETDMPEALFCFYDNLVIFDLLTHECYITAKGILKDAGESIEEIESRLREDAAPYVFEDDFRSEISFNFEKDDYEKSVGKVIDHIVEGDFYISNLTQQMRVQTELPPYALFSKMRKSNPSPFGGYFHYPDFDIVSASPERFIQMKDRYIETKPIKGTRKRGETPEEDEFYRRELQMSEKDRSELLMIVDLERNDLNRICETGSVKVTKHFEIEAFATVFHLVTTIVGRMEEQRTYADLLRAMFPGGSITGAPKIEAMKDMDELEHSARGLYTGSIGYISFNGDCDLNIVIRTAVWQNGIYHIGIGGGITCESDPEAEYKETLQKAKAFIDIFKGEQNESNPT